MARYVAERLERQAHDLDGAKDAVKHLADPERAHLVKWIVRYYDDDGKLLSPYRKDIPLRRTIVIDAIALGRTNSGCLPTIGEAGIPAIGVRWLRRASWLGRFHCLPPPRSALRAGSRSCGVTRFARPHLARLKIR